MDIIRFCLKLLMSAFALSVCQDVSCNWKTQYEHDGICCDACPAGTYPKTLCDAHKPSVCEKCPEGSSKNVRCSCGSEPLCEDSLCSTCMSRPRCKRGEQLRRGGNYKFSYECKPCTNTTYNDAEDSVCEPIADCRKLGMSVLLPGNMTHNAKCGWPREDDLIHSDMEICMAITSLICAVLFIAVCIQRAVWQRRKHKHHQTHPNECTCKLSKEEMGENHEPHISDTLLEVSSKTS